MTAYSVNIFIIFTIYLSSIVRSNHVFKVIQPPYQNVTSSRIASISCEHTAHVTSILDVQLKGISQTGKSKETMLCQKGQGDCKNIVIQKVNNNKWLFFILNIGPDAMNMKYQCEFTVKIQELDYTEQGIPTILVPGEEEVACVHPSPSPSPPPPPPPPPPPHHAPQCHQVRWILIGLLALMFLYSCVITFFYFRLRSSNSDPENSTYVEMRKAPPPRNPHVDFYCG